MTAALVVDSGALSSRTVDDRRRLRVLIALHTQSAKIVVPTVVIAESTTGDGARDAAVNRLVKRAAIDACELGVARRAAELRNAVGKSASAVDAIVVATAERHHAAVLTDDMGDLIPLAAAARPPVRVIPLAHLRLLV